MITERQKILTFLAGMVVARSWYQSHERRSPASERADPIATMQKQFDIRDEEIARTISELHLVPSAEIIDGRLCMSLQMKPA